MREINDIQAEIDIKQEELRSLVNELHLAKNAKNSVVLKAANEKFAGKWIIKYGRDYMLSGPSTINFGKITIAKVVSVNRTYHDMVFATVSPLITVNVDDVDRDPMHENSNLFIKKQDKDELELELDISGDDVYIKTFAEIQTELDKIKDYANNVLLNTEVMNES